MYFVKLTIIETYDAHSVKGDPVYIDPTFIESLSPRWGTEGRIEGTIVAVSGVFRQYYVAESLEDILKLVDYHWDGLDDEG